MIFLKATKLKAHQTDKVLSAAKIALIMQLLSQTNVCFLRRYCFEMDIIILNNLEGIL